MKRSPPSKATVFSRLFLGASAMMALKSIHINIPEYSTGNKEMK